MRKRDGKKWNKLSCFYCSVTLKFIFMIKIVFIIVSIYVKFHQGSTQGLTSFGSESISGYGSGSRSGSESRLVSGSGSGSESESGLGSNQGQGQSQSQG